MLHQALTDEGDTFNPLGQIEFFSTWFVLLKKNSSLPGLNVMMKLETTNRHDWQGFSRILEVMSFVDDADCLSPEQSREVIDKLCQIPACAGETMSMEEVVFWAGVAAGMEISRHTDEGRIDPDSAEKALVFSSIFEHSTKTAIVDLALGDMEMEPACSKAGEK